MFKFSDLFLKLFRVGEWWWCQQLLDLSFSLCSKYVLMHFIICKIISGISLELWEALLQIESLSLNKTPIRCNQKLLLVNFCSPNFGIICQTGTGKKLVSVSAEADVILSNLLFRLGTNFAKIELLFRNVHLYFYKNLWK